MTSLRDSEEDFVLSSLNESDEEEEEEATATKILQPQNKKNQLG